MKFQFFLILSLVSLVARAQDDGLGAFDTPPPGDIYLAAKVDPKLYRFTFGAETGWSFANPFTDDFTLGLNASYLPLAQLRLGLVTNFHFSQSTGLARELNQEIGLRDRELQFAEPRFDVLAHAELRAIHGLVKLFYATTLDYETGLFLRAGVRRSSGAGQEWNALFVPGLSQTLLFSKSFNFRLLLSAEVQVSDRQLVGQGATMQGGLEWRY